MRNTTPPSVAYSGAPEVSSPVDLFDAARDSRGRHFFCGDGLANRVSSCAMSLTEQHRHERRARERSETRNSILDAARRVATRDGARNLSLRAAAAEAGYAPAALYGYFRNKDELLLALAAEDLSGLARAMREVVQGKADGRLNAAASVALDLLENTETFAAVPAALPAIAGSGEAERLFNGRMIAALTASVRERLGETVRRAARRRRMCCWSPPR